MVKAGKSLSVIMVLGLTLPLGMAAVLWWSAEEVSAADFHVTTAAEFQAALSDARNNGEDDTIYLAAGTYQENFTYSPQDDKSLTIKGEPGTTAEDVILDGGGDGKVLRLYCSSDSASVNIEGLTIQNGSESGLYVWCLDGKNLDITLKHAVIQNNTHWHNGGGICLETWENAAINMEIWDSIVRYNQAPGNGEGRLGRGGGIAAHSVYGNSTIELLIVNSLIYKNQANWTGGGIEVSASEVGDNNITRAVVINSTITGNVSDMHDTGYDPGGGIRVWAYSGNGAIASLDLYNSIVYGNTSLGGEPGQDLYVGESEPGNAAVSANHSDIGDVLPAPDTYSPVNVISADPVFVDPATDDYHLAASSPCIDTGTAAVPDPPGLPAEDIEGAARVLGPLPDMGAYEWTGAPPSPTIGFSPTSFSFSATEGGANPADQTLDIWNSGYGTLVWSISDDADWLSLSPLCGSSIGEHDLVALFVDISGMSASSYNGTITITAIAATNSPQTVPVELTVNPPTGEDNPDVATGLASIEDWLVIAYGYKAGEGVGGWTVYNPEWAVTHPEWNSLTTLYVGRGYWINVSQGCDLTYGANTYQLDAGWNLIGWVGW